MKWVYAVALPLLFWSCSKERINTCGLVGIWVCCEHPSSCTDLFTGTTITWTFEDDGDFFSSQVHSSYAKWKTDGDCTELVFDPNTEDEWKIKIDINGDKFMLHNALGDATYCRQ